MSGLINARKQQEQQAQVAAQQQAMMQQEAMMQGQVAAQPEVSPDQIGDGEVLEYIRQTNPEVYERLMSLSPEDQQRAMDMMRNKMGGAPVQNENMVGDL